MGLLRQPCCLIALFVKLLARADYVITETGVELGFLLNLVLKVVEHASRFSDFIACLVQPRPGFVLASSFVVVHHAVTILHLVNFVVDAAVVARLAPQIEQLLSQVSYKLVFLTRANLDSLFSALKRYEKIVGLLTFCLLAISVLING